MASPGGQGGGGGGGALSTRGGAGARRMKWALELSMGNARSRVDRQGGQGDVVFPIGYSEKPVPDNSIQETDKNLVEKRCWDVALGPLKQIPMNLFIMYMSGNTISIFPIMMVCMMAWRPIQALMSMSATFKLLESSSQQWLQGLVYLVGNLLGSALAIYKCQSMGLLPTHSSDWLAFIEPPQGGPNCRVGGVAAVLGAWPPCWGRGRRVGGAAAVLGGVAAVLGAWPVSYKTRKVTKRMTDPLLAPHLEVCIAMEKRDGHVARADFYPHPFIHAVRLTTAQRVKGIILGSVLFPVRMALALLFFMLMWPSALLRSAGLSQEARLRPIRGWRRWLPHALVWSLTRLIFYCMGFFWIKVKGRRADLKEAAVLVVAPHSSFFDMIVFAPTQLATVVSRSENRSLPVIGALLEFNQSVVVSRKDPESRKNAVAMIKERLTSDGCWPQMLMFPEGTTTNGTVLMKFKPGAFLAGVPVQPVLLFYPNKKDTMRWTYKGTSWLAAIWHTTCQVYTNVTVEYLPVYTPSQEEKDEPSLYAENVRKLMAKSLGLPATEYVMEGRVPVRKLGGLSLPVEPPAKPALALLRRDRVGVSDAMALLRSTLDECHSGARAWTMASGELAAVLGLAKPLTAGQICALYSKDDTVDLRRLYLGLAATSGHVDFKSLLRVAFSMYDPEGRGNLHAEALSGLMGALLGATQHDTAQLFSTACRDDQLTEEDLLRVLTTHPTYQVVVNEYLKPEEAGCPPPDDSSTNGKLDAEK
ncbi:hypothetical protein NHX12_014027, partial [Muraenolepis orangiensis]